MAIEIKSFNQFLGNLIRAIRANTPLNDINDGSALFDLLEAIASNDYDNNVQILNVLELQDIDALRNNDLDAKAADFGLERRPAVRSSGFVTISDSNISKRSTTLFPVKNPPIAGATQIFVNNAVELARLLGISEVVIGLTLIAIGTSIPELATAILAALRKQSDIAVGNVIGSNIFNVLCVLGITALFSVLNVGALTVVDFVAMLIFALVLLPLAKSGLTLSRKEGFLLVAAYLSYLSYLGWNA